MRESDEHKAERLVAELLRQADCSATELKDQPKGDGKKARMALRLRQETP